jgi:murein DD-endopeptidase MepM/ murein hydrolase activator NlpD
MVRRRPGGAARVPEFPRQSRARRGAFLAALAGVAVPLLLWAVLPLGSSGATPGGRLDRLQDKIEATQGKIGRRKGTERVLTTEISAYTRRIDRLQGRIGSLQQRQSTIETDLAAQRAALARIQSDLRAERRRLVRLRARLQVTRRALAHRLVELYTAEQPDLVTVILSAKGFTDLLERGEFLRRVSDQDRKIVEVVRSARADAVATEHRLDHLEERQAAVTQTIQQRRDEVAAVKHDLIGTRVGYARTRAGKDAALHNVRAERQQLEGALSELKAQQAKIRSTLLASQGQPGLPAAPIRQGSGSMIWPVNGPITSPFCEARAWERCHPGIDIGVPAGTPIRAAAAGRVVLMQSVGASGGYGNFTCIQHSGSLSTCYAHQSRFATSLGANVSQGQVIGYVGCTGLCFGDHLHFEVRVNGSVVNPMAYL